MFSKSSVDGSLSGDEDQPRIVLDTDDLFFVPHGNDPVTFKQSDDTFNSIRRQMAPGQKIALRPVPNQTAVYSAMSAMNLGTNGIWMET